MSWGDFLVVALGLVSFLFIIYTFVRDPFRWTYKPASGSIPKSEGKCKSLSDFVRGHKKIIFAGETLWEVTTKKYDLLQKLADKKGAQLEFFIANPALGKDDALFQVMTRRLGIGVTSEELYKNLEQSVAKLQELRENHTNVLINVVDYIIGPSFVLVDPDEKRGKVRISLNRFCATGQDRLTFSEIAVGDLVSGALYEDVRNLYNDLKNNSDPLPQPLLAPTKTT